MAGQANSVRTILFALGANFGIFLGKLVAAVFTGSSSMLAEAVHSLADCGNQGLLLFGMRRSRRPPTPEHPLGSGKEIYFWSFLVALMLFSVGGAYSLYEGWHKLQHPTALSKPWLAVGVLVMGIVLEAVSLRACLAEIAKVREGRSYWRWFRQSRNSELLVIFGEDIAALLGLVLALAAIVATMLTGNPVWDALGTLAIGGLLVVVALFVAVEVKGLLVGQGVEPATHQAIHDWLLARPEVGGIFNLVTMQMGEQVMVAVKAAMHEAGSGGELIARINAVEAGLKQAFPQVQWLFFEPDESD